MGTKQPFNRIGSSRKLLGHASLFEPIKNTLTTYAWREVLIFMGIL
jgi:hypothetical protein